MQFLNPFHYIPSWSETDQTIKALETKLKECNTYEEWQKVAEELDDLKGNDIWKSDPKSDIYDYELIQTRLRILKRAHADMPTDRWPLVRVLRSGLLRNLGGMGTPLLYNRVHIGTKRLIEEYVSTVVQSLRDLSEDLSFSLQEKFDFFWETRQSFGRSALLLSGGASLGLYHLGVIKTLFEHRFLPRVISGSSVGSIIASMIATRTDEEIPDLLHLKGVSFSAFDPVGSGWRKINRLLNKGVLMDVKKLQSYIRDNLGDVTFREAFQRTKRILNITVAPASGFDVPRLLNYLTSPDVLIWSAASASCALTGLYEPVELMAKERDGKIVPYHPSIVQWSDGSVLYDLPMARLSELFNVNHFIVSQVNPHVVPFVSSTNKIGQTGVWNVIKQLATSEISHRITQAANLGIIPRQLDFFLGVMSQTYRGHITIVPELTITDYGKLLANPTPEWIHECILKSERNTWCLLSMIKHHTAIEIALDSAVQRLRKKLNEEPQKAFQVYNTKLKNHY